MVLTGGLGLSIDTVRALSVGECEVASGDPSRGLSLVFVLSEMVSLLPDAWPPPSVALGGFSLAQGLPLFVRQSLWPGAQGRRGGWGLGESRWWDSPRAGERLKRGEIRPLCSTAPPTPKEEHTIVGESEPFW